MDARDSIDNFNLDVPTHHASQSVAGRSTQLYSKYNVTQIEQCIAEPRATDAFIR